MIENLEKRVQEELDRLEWWSLFQRVENLKIRINELWRKNYGIKESNGCIVFTDQPCVRKNDTSVYIYLHYWVAIEDHLFEQEEVYKEFLIAHKELTLFLQEIANKYNIEVVISEE